MLKRLLTLNIEFEIAQYTSGKYYTWLLKRSRRAVNILDVNYLKMWENEKVKRITERSFHALPYYLVANTQDMVSNDTLNDKKLDFVSSYLFKEERGSIIEAAEDLISTRVFTDSRQLDIDTLRQLFCEYNPDGIQSKKSSDMQVSTYLFETYCCIFLMKNESDRIELLQDHTGLMEKLGKISGHADNHSMLWKDHFYLIVASNLTIEFLDSCTEQVFPKEILSIIISDDIMCGERILFDDAQKLVYHRMKTCFSI
jgi:hypothetical protein